MKQDIDKLADTEALAALRKETHFYHISDDEFRDSLAYDSSIRLFKAGYTAASTEIECLKTENDELKRKNKAQVELTAEFDDRIGELQSEVLRLRAALSLAEDLATHPFLYAEASLRNPSLKARWDNFMEFTSKVEK